MSQVRTRYGGTRGPFRNVIGYTVLTVVAATMALGWTIGLMNYWSTDSVNASVIRYEIQQADQAVTVVYDVHKPSDKAVTCRIEATGADHQAVGHKNVTSPAGKSNLRVTSRVATTGEPVTGQVKNCRTHD